MEIKCHSCRKLLTLPCNYFVNENEYHQDVLDDNEPDGVVHICSNKCMLKYSNYLNPKINYIRLSDECNAKTHICICPVAPQHTVNKANWSCRTCKSKLSNCLCDSGVCDWICTSCNSSWVNCTCLQRSQGRHSKQNTKPSCSCDNSNWSCDNCHFSWKKCTCRTRYSNWRCLTCGTCYSLGISEGL